MSDRWVDLDALMRRLGGLRVGADAVRCSPDGRMELDAVIANAAQTINDAIEASDHPKAVGAARAALLAVEDAIARVVKAKAG